MSAAGVRRQLIEQKGYQDEALPSVETIRHRLNEMGYTFKGKQPVVKLIEKGYQTGVKLSQKAMAELEQQINRFPNLPKWFVEITSKPT
ncbi:MAG: hypothetical protein QNJ72_18145 [Pleurocapsa sp. MO_226.B13]|nr:hypothetical protein [Pleurocapsa sp. MO_226.B13]